jgi:2-hydroxychromene-2-carboxylate isomerase
MQITVTHFTDPGCPWAYSARPAHAALRWRYGSQLDWRLVMIGLAERAEVYEDRGYTPERQVQGYRMFAERFGMPFAYEPKARVSGTSRACRAVLIARDQDPALGEAVLRALQFAQFASTGRFDDDADLRAALADVDGLDADAVVGALDDDDVRARYEVDRALTRSAEGTPTHAQGKTASYGGPERYTAPSLIFRHPDGRTLEAGGFQSLEAYDVILANLEPTLERQAAAEDPREAVLAFPEGLTTAEVAEVVRPPLAPADLASTRARLHELADEGVLRRVPVGDDALWIGA